MPLLQERLRDIDRFEGSEKSARGSKRNRRAVVPPGLDPLFEDLADVAGSVGSSQFYQAAASCVMRALSSGRALVIRYAKFSKPEFLVNTSMTDEAVENYLARYYRIDPLLRMVRTGVEQNVLTFDQLRQSGADTLYYEGMYQTAEILDELVILLPTTGGIWTAICVDRADDLFSPREIEMAAHLFPLLNNLHALHVDRCVFGWRGGYLDDSQIAFMMIDTQGQIAFRNALWENRVGKARETEIRKLSGDRAEGFEALEDDLIVHWETLDHQNAVAPGGRAYLLEEASPSYVDLSETELVEQFASRHGLTPRETEIVGYILKGVPPALIAETMSLSAGTIRNHKHRLYYKLDITTERELFCMFFELIIANR